MKKEPISKSQLNIWRIYGNPGTGKTTIARIVAKMMSEAGVLTDGDFIEINARELSVNISEKQHLKQLEYVVRLMDQFYLSMRLILY